MALTRVKGSVKVDRPFLTVNEMRNARGVQVGDECRTKEFSTGNGGGGIYDAVLTSAVTPNGRDIIQSVANPLISFKLRIEKEVRFDQLGIFDDAGASDRKADIQAAINLSLALELPLNGTYGTFRLDSVLDKINEDFTFYSTQKGSFILLRNYSEADPKRGVLHAEAGTQDWKNIYIHAAAGTAGGAGFSLVSTATTSPDFSKGSGCLATSPSGGTFANTYYFDGSARTGSPAGLRDLVFTDSDAFAATNELVNIISCNNARIGINCFSAGGTATSMRVTGVAGNTSNNVQVVCSSLPDLKLDYTNNFCLVTSAALTSVTNTSNVDVAIVIAPNIGTAQYFWTRSQYICQNINTLTGGPLQIWTGSNGSPTNNLELSYNPTSGVAYVGPQAGGSTEMELRTASSGTYRATHKIDSAGSWIFLTTQTAASAANSSLFVDSADNKLKYKDSGGTTNLLY